MTGHEVTHEDAALARSLQLAADLEFAELSQMALRNQRRNKIVVHYRNNHQSSSSDPNPYGRPSRRRNVRRVPDPPEDGGIAVTSATRRSGRHSSRSGNNGEPERKRRSSVRRRNIQPVPSSFEPSHSMASVMLCDGSKDEAKNKNLLYVPCEINDRLVEMMVDTGAQTSVISTPLMEKLCLDKKLNREKQGVAAGVGTARILGRIENCPVQIGHVEFLLYFAVLDVDTDMMILGIDQMRRFNCLVDLQHDKLIFGGKGGVEVDFFTQHQSR